MNRHYESNKRWRLSHPEARKAQNRRYYRKHGLGHNRGNRWSKNEEIMITHPNRPCDVVLSETLGRSVRAIQAKRTKMQNEKKV
jgi:hypothetical protein